MLIFEIPDGMHPASAPDDLRGWAGRVCWPPVKTCILKTAFLLLTMFLLTSRLGAESVTSATKVQFKSQKVFSWPDGKELKAPDEIILPFSIVVRTNGTFTVKGGKERTLLEGELLGADGMLTRPDGSITPVIDHLTLSRGHVVVFRDGTATELREALKLGDGSTVSPDGKFTPPSGSTRRLLDGELFLLEGGKLPSRDTITMKNGRVIVQKDGTRLEVEPARSITMNDGTKVLGDGTVIKPGGERTKLDEGEIITLEGVITKPR